VVLTGFTDGIFRLTEAQRAGEDHVDAAHLEKATVRRVELALI